MVLFICYLMVCSFGPREIHGGWAGPPRVPPCGTCAAHQLPGCPSTSGWTDAPCPGWWWGCLARRGGFLRAHSGAGTAREASPGAPGGAQHLGWGWTRAQGHGIRDSSLFKPNLLSPCTGEAGPAGFTSDSWAWRRLCSGCGSVSRLFNPSTVDVYCCCSVTKLYLTPCNPVDRSLPGSSVHGILQARILEWAALPSSKGSFQPRVDNSLSSGTVVCLVAHLAVSLTSAHWI